MKATEEPTDFTIEQQWRRFLVRAGAVEEDMHPVQVSEMKKAFYAASGQTLLLARDEIGELSEEVAVEKLEAMLEEIGEFWKQKNKEYEESIKKGK